MTRNFSEISEKAESKDSAGFVEALQGAGRTKTIGYRVGGTRPGPTVVVAGYSSLADTVFERLLALPSLPWMRGTLFLIKLEALDGIDAFGDGLPNIETMDRVLHLPFSETADNKGKVSNESYWQVLGLCAELGMIAGRGVNTRDSTGQ